MLNWTHARLRILSLTVLGSVVGTLGGSWLGQHMLLRAAKSGLSTYSAALMRNTDDMADELNSIFGQTDTPAAGVCSDQDIAGLQAETFRSIHVKDIGRTREGKLYCSAFLGRLVHPYVEGTPSLVLAHGALNVYTNVAVLLAAQTNGHGTVVESGDLDIVLNPIAFGDWDRAHISYMVVAVNRETGQMVQITGSKIEIDSSSVLSPGPRMAGGSIFRSVCSSKHPTCVVTAERIADIWPSARSTQIAYSAMGGFAGLSLGLAIALFYQRSFSLGSQLLRAIRKNSPSLSLVYQPIMNVRTGRCMGAEALLRWTDQKGASISPEVFIPLAEETGIINELTALVVRRATGELLELLRSCQDFTLSINIAASDLGDEALFELLRERVYLAGIRTSQIALELTERSTADLTLLSAAIQRLCAEGYKVHIDDFGVGFSSLSYIDQLHVNAIKIDRTFTRTIGTNALMAPILGQMLDMARSLGVDVVVEGVETEFQRDYLAASSMALQAQGWYFSRPLSVETLYLFEVQNRAMHEAGLRQRQGKLLSSESCASTGESSEGRPPEPACAAEIDGSSSGEDALVPASSVGPR